MSNNRLWILGAADVEMAAIEKLLTECGETFCFSVGPDGQHVHPGNAYKACDPSRESLHEYDHVVCVECALDCERDHDPLTLAHVDHHRPGDPGFGRPATDFLKASSIGQVLAFLCRHNIIMTTGYNSGRPYYERTADLARMPLIYIRDAMIIAAADHCLAAAYRGECPGVDPEELMVWRIAQRAAFQKRSVEDVMKDVLAARAVLRERAATANGVADMRDCPMPELPEAAVREGVAYLATVTDRDGRVKDVLGGHTTPELVQRWMDEQKAAGRETYGDPARGFAGAYR